MFFPLSPADLKTFIAARERSILFLSNDSHLLRVADQEDVLALDMYDVFRILYTKEALTEETARNILSGMEEEDNAVFTDKGRIFK